jgi:hypothetical protein
MAANPAMEPELLGALNLVRRTGAKQVQVRYSDDEAPVVWIAVGGWFRGPDGVPVASGDELIYEAAAGPSPTVAMNRLLDQIVDGGVCPNCERPTGFIAKGEALPPEGSAMQQMCCWWTWSDQDECYGRDCDGKLADGS